MTPASLLGTAASPAPEIASAIQRGNLPVRACLVLNLIGAGVPGAMLLATPALATDVVGAGASTEVARLVGAIWLAIGAVSAVGLARPDAMRGLLAAQIAYKSIYVAAVGVPAIAGRTASSTTTGLTVGFAAIAFGWSAALWSTRNRQNRAS